MERKLAAILCADIHVIDARASALARPFTRPARTPAAPFLPECQGLRFQGWRAARDVPFVP